VQDMTGSVASNTLPPYYLGGVSLFDDWAFGPVVAFGAAASEPLDYRPFRGGWCRRIW
jgi:hypothetical protein